MHREWVDRRAEGSGRLHDWDPRLKVLLTLVTLLWISFGCTEPTEKSAARLVAIGAATIALAMRGGIPLRGLFLRSLVIVPFVGFIAVARAIVVVRGRAEGLELGPWTIAAAPDGLEAALLIVARAWVSVLASLVLVLTTPLPAILAVLERWRVPRGLLETCSLVYRYLWVLLDEGGRLLLARKLRGGVGAPWRSGGAMLGTMFVRALDRGQRIEIALRLRGYRGTLPVGRELTWKSHDSARAVFAACLLVGVWIGSTWLLGDRLT